MDQYPILHVGTTSVYMDFMVVGAMEEPLMISFYDRAAQTVRAAGARLCSQDYQRIAVNSRSFAAEDTFQVAYATIAVAKERFTHGMAISKGLENKYLVTTDVSRYEDLYDFLMNRFSLPLLKEWMPEIWKRLQAKSKLCRGYKGRIYGEAGHAVEKGGQKILLSKLEFWRVYLDDAALAETVSSLLKEDQIWISPLRQKKLSFSNMDEYFQKYGKSIVENLKGILRPVSELNGEANRICLCSKRLYPQQAAMVNGVYEYLHKKRRGYVLFSMGTGTGKTIQGASAAEMLYVGKWLKQHPKKELSDAYAEDGIIHYRHIIMCPGHLVEKWKKELLNEIPYAKPVIIDRFSQLVELRARGRERNDGKEYYIMSKDFLKLSYQRIPTPKKQAYKPVYVLKCQDCNTRLIKPASKCPYCESKNIVAEKTTYMRYGMVCPNCNKLLWEQNMQFDMEVFFKGEDDPHSQPLRWSDFACEKETNQSCIYCGESLWMPYVKNIHTTAFGMEKKPSWIRQTFWTNKSHKGKKTVWVLRDHKDEACELWGSPLNSMEESTGGCRKYSPAAYIKKYLKGYFDVFIADEVHKAKGGSTAQGNAFHALCKSARYTFGLTGTIAGGVATDLFYLLFRLEPKRMVEKGFSWNSVMNFAKEYGTVEETFLANEDVRRNTFSRGRQLMQPRVLPGISPKVFSEFLLDRCVFLEIVDMSASMPPLIESIELVKARSKAEQTMLQKYHRALDYLKDYSRDNKVNLMSVSQQLAMSYPDKPYGVPAIINPKTGDTVLCPDDYGALIADGGMLAKEKRLVEIIEKELSKGRNCAVYVEYSMSEATNILPRLKGLLMEKLGLSEAEVVVMQAGTPSALKREAWMHRKAAEGMKVMLCNPRLCETGLDFCWREEGVVYNYPTLIFYQCGYSLFVIWQAAGRSWRLNQREECHTYYLAYQGTVQQAILQVLGEKKSATAAIQGRFSSAGLAAMAHGVDTQVRIAQIMAEMDKDSGNKLQEMFDTILNSKDEDYYGKCQKMKLFGELIKQVKETMEENPDVFAYDIFRSFEPEISKEDSSKNDGNEIYHIFGDLLGKLAGQSEAPARKMKSRRRREKIEYEQTFMSLFS